MYYSGYNPRVFEKDKRYLDRKHYSDINAFLKDRFKRNKGKMNISMENTASAFIEGGTNLYNNEVDYTEWKNEEGKYDKWVIKRKNELNRLDKYYRMNKQALFWTYINKDNNKPDFKAVHASEFAPVYKVNENGKIEGFIIRSGEYPKQQLLATADGSTASVTDWEYIFKLIINGKYYKKKANSWDDVIGDINIEHWEEEEGRWDTMPLTLIGKESSMPIESNLPLSENILVTGGAYADSSALRNFLNMIYGQTHMNGAEWLKFVESISGWEYPNVPLPTDGSGGVTPTINSLNLGDAKVQLDWELRTVKALLRTAVSEGVDIMAFMPETKVESGISRLLQMQHVINYRKERIVTFKQFEEEDQKVLLSLKISSEESEPDFAPLMLAEVEADRLKNEGLRIANINARYETGSITRLRKVMELENLTEENAKKRITEIDSERGENIEEENLNNDESEE